MEGNQLHLHPSNIVGALGTASLASDLAHFHFELISRSISSNINATVWRRPFARVQPYPRPLDVGGAVQHFTALMG